MQTHKLTSIMTCALVAFMCLLAAFGFFAGESAATGFGFPLAQPADAFYLHVKGDRDLAIGLALAALLVTRQRRALAVVLGAFVLMPLIDATLLLASGHASLFYVLAVHGSAALYVAILALLLARENAHDHPASRATSRVEHAAEA
jgi:hypothetical protein